MLLCKACAGGQFAQARAGAVWCCLQLPVALLRCALCYPGTRQDTSGCNQSSVWLKYLGRDSRGRKSSPGCSALSQCLCHRVRRMVNSCTRGTGDGMCWGQPVESFLLPLRSPTQNRSLTHPNVLFAVCVPKAKQVLKQGESGPKYQLCASCSSPFLSKIPDRFPRCGFFLIGIKISWEQSSAPDIGKNRALQYFLRRRRPVLMAK